MKVDELDTALSSRRSIDSLLGLSQPRLFQRLLSVHGFIWHDYGLLEVTRVSLPCHTQSILGPTASLDLHTTTRLSAIHQNVSSPRDLKL